MLRCINFLYPYSQNSSLLTEWRASERGTAIKTGWGSHISSWGAQGRCIMPLPLIVLRSFRTPVLFILRGCGLMRNDEGREAAEWVGIHMLCSTGNPLLLCTDTYTRRDAHLSLCRTATSLRKALQSQCAMSSLCQHILYPSVNVTEYNQSPEQPGGAVQWKTACVTGMFPRLL